MTPPPKAIPSRSASVTDRLRSCDGRLRDDERAEQVVAELQRPRDGQVPAARRAVISTVVGALPSTDLRRSRARSSAGSGMPCRSVEPWNAGTQ